MCKYSPIHNHNSTAKGFMNENTPGFIFSGFLIIILMPVFMKGLEKSTTLSLSMVIVRGATAKSAS